MAITHFPIQTLPATASNVACTPTGVVTATNVQSALDTIGTGRKLLNLATTFFVRKDGSDANDGLTNNAAGAFLTISAAVAAIEALDGQNQTINVQIATGTYTENFKIGNVTGAFTGDNIFVFGDGSLPIIDGAIDVKVREPFQWHFSLLKFLNSGGGTGNCFDVDGGFIYIDTVEWGAATGDHVSCENGGVAVMAGPHTISGGASTHFRTNRGGICVQQNSIITLTGPPTFGSVFAFADNFGEIGLEGNTYIGTATGAKFFIGSGSNIKTNTNDVTVLPGSTPGNIFCGFYDRIMGCAYPITAVPRVVTAAAGTISTTDSSIICNFGGTVTLTFPTAANYSGRWIQVKTVTNNTVISAASNIQILAGVAVGTAILAATAGRWANLQSDGTNWVIMAGN